MNRDVSNFYLYGYQKINADGLQQPRPKFVSETIPHNAHIAVGLLSLDECGG